jgi:dTDP-4-dehydrorhamnose reductase
LVAGKEGQVARSLVEKARGRGLPIVALGRPSLDIGDPESISRAISTVNPCLVINAAAYTAVDQAESEIDQAFRINRDGARWLAAAASDKDIPYIYISTDYVFDGRKHEPYLEEDSPCPLSVYGRSKLEGEMAVLEICKTAVVLRTSWIFSAYGHNFLRTMIRLARERELVRVVDDQCGAPTEAGAFASAILDVAETLLSSRDAQSKHGIYHLAASGSTSWYGFAEAVFAGWRMRGHRVPVLERIRSVDYPTPVHRPMNSRLDCSKSEAVFSTRLPDWRTTIDGCLDYLDASSGEQPR